MAQNLPSQSIKTNNTNNCNLAKLIHQGGEGAVWASVRNRFFLLSNKCESLLSDIHRPSKPKAREGRQVNEGKSIVRGSEEIPNMMRNRSGS